MHGPRGVSGGFQRGGHGFADGVLLLQHGLEGIFPRAEEGQIDARQHLELRVGRARAQGVDPHEAGGIPLLQFPEERRGGFGIDGARDALRVHEGLQLHSHDVGQGSLRLRSGSALPVRLLRQGCGNGAQHGLRVMLRLVDAPLQDRQGEAGDEAVVPVSAGQVGEGRLHGAGMDRQQDPAGGEGRREDKERRFPPRMHDVDPGPAEEQGGSPPQTRQKSQDQEHMPGAEVDLHDGQAGAEDGEIDAGQRGGPEHGQHGVDNAQHQPACRRDRQHEDPPPEEQADGEGGKERQGVQKEGHGPFQEIGRSAEDGQPRHGFDDEVGEKGQQEQRRHGMPFSRRPDPSPRIRRAGTLRAPVRFRHAVRLLSRCRFVRITV